MKRTAYFHWINPNPNPRGKPTRTRFRMTLEVGRQRFPNGHPEADTVEWRDVPETDEERVLGLNTKPNGPGFRSER